MTVFYLLLASKKFSDPSKFDINTFDINTYLEKCSSDKGRCRHYQRVVPWVRGRVTSYKRANCMGTSTKNSFSLTNTSCNSCPLQSARV
ncbi:hypothetical protein PHMEG_00014607 [Phytophthora megakarya]|uniref:Uncharacterized protein n=1 Tax=Phytophthora megakarya TaxID=4795 RepID=A0A225W4Y8_9STRA|nr:hypothetical protein PHMEG_00014607 [Phytophthora megakarya]